MDKPGGEKGLWDETNVKDTTVYGDYLYQIGGL